MCKESAISPTNIINTRARSPTVPLVAALMRAAILVAGSAGAEDGKFDSKGASGVPFIKREAAERPSGVGISHVQRVLSSWRAR